MKTALIIAERELQGFFTSSLAYVLLVVWLLFQGAVFTLGFALAAQGDLGGESPLAVVLGGWVFFHIINLAFVPALTMRSIADEYRSGNIDTVLSTPITETAFLMGKWLAGVAMWVALWVPTLIYVWLTSRFGDLDMGTVLSSYIGILTLGLSYVALGVLGSAIAKTQLTAFLFGFMLIACLFILGIFSYPFPEGTLRDFANYVSVWEHMSTYTRGIVDSRYLMFELTMTVVPLFITHRILVARRLA